MNNYEENKHLGVYGILILNNKILLIKKVTGPYDGKLDLPGGSILFGEKIVETLKREFKEETGINVLDYYLYDTDSVVVSWKYNNKKIITHHVGIFYIINSYDGDILNNIKLDKKNDDSLGASFYDLSLLNKNDLSDIAILELLKLGYCLK